VDKFMSESCHVGYISLKLGSDLEIRIQGKLCSDTTTFFFVLQSQFNKAVCNSPLKVEPAALISASWLKVMTSFFWPSQWVPQLSSAQCALHLEVKYAIEPKVWVATQTRVAISLRSENR